MILFPHCKINLGLRIIAKRQDGYHDLQTLFYPIPFSDSLELVQGNTVDESDVAIITEGIKIEGDPKNNLILKAYYLLKKEYALPKVTFCLLKNIPIGAGLGGGSSDGAFVIRLLNQYFKLNISIKDQLNFAAKLGSDCPFFIYSQPCLGSGRGEILKPINFSLSGYWIVLVKPDLHISTAEAFAKIKPKGSGTPDSVEAIISKPIGQWQGALINDFEDSLFPIYPILLSIKEKLISNGAEYASMSGSGSTLFGIYKSEPKFKEDFSNHFYWQGQLN
jgi:4-diphosphocytidyl-2-C-methyl-D-erythritol kinase